MHQPRPSDFDFPMSDSFRGYTFDYCLLPDPGRYETYNEQNIPKMHQRIPTNKEVIDKMHEVNVNINDLANRMNTHIDKSKKRREQRY